MKTFFNIAMSGLSKADAREVLQTLESPELGNWSLSEGGFSDLLLIDVDSVWGHMDWLRAVADGRCCAAYTEQESMRDCELLLHKPLDTRALIDVLLKVQGEPKARRPKPAAPKAAPRAPVQEPGPAPASSPGTAEPAPLSALEGVPTVPARLEAVPVQAFPADVPEEDVPEEPAAAVPPAAEPVAGNVPEMNGAHAAAAPAASPSKDASASVGALLLAGGIEYAVMVRDEENGTTLFIDPARNVYRAPPQLKPLETLLGMSVAQLAAAGADDPQVQHAGPEQPIVRLLWFAALSASDGKLAPHLDPSLSWKLTRWPQIEREFPRHFRIATAMMKQAGTLDDVAEAAKSPVEDVADFINAYYVAGYVAAEGSDEPEDAANSTAKVLSRLRRTFTRGTRQVAAG